MHVTQEDFEMAVAKNHEEGQGRKYESPAMVEVVILTIVATITLHLPCHFRGHDLIFACM